MQLSDLIKPISKMSDEELAEHLRGIRHRRETARPVAKAKAERAEKKETRVATKKVDSLIKGMSAEDRAKLIAALGG